MNPPQREQGAFTGGAAQYTDRELLLLIGEKLTQMMARLDRIDERLTQGDRRFSELERAIEANANANIDTRNASNRAINSLANLMDAHASKYDKLDQAVDRLAQRLDQLINQQADRLTALASETRDRLETLEEHAMIDGDDGKPVSLRELFIREQRRRLKVERFIAVLTLASPIIALLLQKLLS